MEQENLYQRIREDHISLPSHLIMTYYDDIERYTYEEIEKRFKQIPFIEEASFNEEDGVLYGNFIVDGKEYACDLLYSPFEDDSYKNYVYQVGGFTNMPDNGMPKLPKATGNLSLSMEFHDNPRADYILQLRILCALSDHIAVIYDDSALRVLPMERVQYLLSMETLPAYDILYSVHATYDPDGTYWLHTHGLHRCAMIELELIKIKENINEYFELLNATVKRFLEEGLPSEEEHMNVGYASMVNLDVKWTPWEKAMEQETKRHLFQKKAEFCGSLKDRQEDHNGPSGVLYAFYENQFQSITVYDKFLSDNPILYISNQETARMAAYAKEAFAHFRRLFDEHKDDHDNYVFMIKAGLDVDASDEICGEREHLWFEVKEVKETSFSGELINEPYGVSYMKEGQEHEIDLTRLSDYLILRRDAVNLNPNDMYLYDMEHPMN